ncbi:MAG: ATP-binding protein [Bacteroidales bacterium]|nr:ATP-binding protein [Bacteroidales bacterium]
MKNEFTDFPELKTRKRKSTKKIETIKPEDLTIFSALDQIVEVSAGCKLKLSVFDKIKPTIDFITKKLEITPIQAMFLAVLANNAPRRICMDIFSDFFECSNLHVMRYAENIDKLLEKRYIRKNDDGREYSYMIPKEVMAAFKKNKIYEAEEYNNLTSERIFEYADEMFVNVNNTNMDWEDFVMELRAMLLANKDLNLSKRVREYNLTDDAFVVLMTFCLHYIFIGKSELSGSCFDFLPHRIQGNTVRMLKRGAHVLMDLNLVEFVSNDGMSDNTFFKLTEKAKNELLVDVNVIANTRDKNLMLSDSIAEKPMYYNKDEASQITQLTDLLSKERFGEVQKRLKENGFRTGFACLFYGAPGTGKTETVLQIARQTGRNVMQVNISEIKSKWVGESEKNVKEIFDRYRSYVERCETTPILFFNEADAVFNTRIEKTQHAIDKMENSIQNIILQELENLNGILIATTNLSDNIDSAFDRRFLYKVKFANPNIETKKSIWKVMIPEISDSEAMELASTYNLSGGQIENVARKRTVEYILTGTSVPFSKLKEYSDTEKLMRKEHKVVGF